MIKMPHAYRAALLSVFVTALALATDVRASDAYFVAFEARGRGNIVWRDSILLHNPGSAPATVRFVELSNGGTGLAPLTLVLPPGKTVGLYEATGGSWRVRLVPAVPLWVLHLDVPEGVIVESRNQLFLDAPFGGVMLPVPYGKVPMPIIRQLTPAGQPQVHIGTDLGGVNSRINVVLYNAGAETATATIEVRRACSDVVIDSRVVTVPPNTAVQAGGLVDITSPPGSSDCPAGTSVPWARNTFVTMTQPGFSVVSNINENIVPDPATIGTIPIVGLGVEHNARF
jgi:hypothetical protein